MDHEHDVPGAGPTRILSLADGDAPEVPQEVEAELRRPQAQETAWERRARILRLFRTDFRLFEDSVLCMRDWTRSYPDLVEALEATARDVVIDERARYERFAPLADISAPPSPPDPEAVAPSPEKDGEPTPGALAVLAMTTALVSMVLGIFRLFGADIGVVWVLAPMWGSALAITLAGAVSTTIEWAGRNG